LAQLDNQDNIRQLALKAAFGGLLDARLPTRKLNALILVFLGGGWIKKSCKVQPPLKEGVFFASNGLQRKTCIKNSIVSFKKVRLSTQPKPVITYHFQPIISATESRYIYMLG